MSVSFDLISGCMFGIEFGEDDEGDGVIIIDLFIIRVLIG